MAEYLGHERLKVYQKGMPFASMRKTLLDDLPRWVAACSDNAQWRSVMTSSSHTSSHTSPHTSSSTLRRTLCRLHFVAHFVAHFVVYASSRTLTCTPLVTCHARYTRRH
jgi:hypothetical protein